MLWKNQSMRNTVNTECLSYNKEGLDKELSDMIDDNVNMMVPWYLMAAYAYYEEDNPILSDAIFDRLAKRMIEHWDEIEHQHKEYITLDMLHGGTYIGKYPSRVEGGLKSLREVYKIGTKHRKRKKPL